MSETKKEEELNPQEAPKQEETKNSEPEKAEEKAEVKTEEEKPVEQPKEEQKEEPKEESKEEQKEEQKEETKEETKESEPAQNPEQDKKEEKELTPEEEDKQDLYDAIQDLKPEEASDNIKSKLLIMADLFLDYKKFENEKYGVEYDKLQDKYDKKYQEIYDKIEEIVSSKENIELTQEEKDKYGITDDGEAKSIDDYWEKVIINSRYFTITDKDKIILKYLTKVKIEKFPENLNDFRVDFYFKENEFFSNDILSKTYIYNKDATLKKAEGTKINWKSPEKNTTIEKVRKKTRKGKRVFNEEKEKFVDSFFAIFEQVDDMNILTDEVGFFKEDLFLNQLEYYLDIVSKTKNGDFDDGEDYDDGYDDGYGNNYDNNNYDKYDKGKKGGKYGGNGGNDGKKEECKNQ